MKKFVVVLLVLGITAITVLTGCGEEQDYTPLEDDAGSTNGNAVVDDEDTVEPGVLLHKEPSPELTWISPGKVMVGNFYPGARAEWVLQVHSGSSIRTDTKQVTTEKNETAAYIPLNSSLYGSYSDIEVGSDIGESLRITDYDEATQQVYIVGFKANTTRILTVTYQSFANFEVKYRYPDHTEEIKITTSIEIPKGVSSYTVKLDNPLLDDDTAKANVQSSNTLDELIIAGYQSESRLLAIEGFDRQASRTLIITYAWDRYEKPPKEAQDWVIIADSTPVLMPEETRDILVVLEMPKDAEVFASHWEFWISVIDTTGENVKTGTNIVRTELASRWLVIMR